MKNFTNNFKQFTSRLSARWLIMALMILVGTSSAWGKIIYLNVDNWWANDGAWFDAWVWGSSQTDNWYTAVKPNGETYYQIEVPDDATGMKILRKDPSSKEHNWNEWNNSGDLTISNDKNLYKTSGSWSTYQLTSNASLSASSTTVSTNTEVTLTPSLTSNTTYNEIKSTAYSINPATDASITGNTFTATAAGEYTVTATVTYNAKGYTGITKTATATTTIEVTNPYTFPTVSTISATINGDDLVCEGKITSMGSASTVVWAFTVLSTDAISKAHSDWKYPDGQNQITTANTDFEYSIPISSLSLTSGTTYYVRAMAVDLNNLGWADNQYGNAVAGDAVSFVYNPCIELPDNAYSLSTTSAEWTGSDITPTISKKDNNYPTPTITYNGKSDLPKDADTYTVVATVSGNATYCDKTFNLGTFTITCPTIAAPDITTSATVCAGTQVTLSNYNGVNDNTVNVKWYSSQEFNSEVTEQVILTDDGTKYYAKAYHVASGCYSSEYSTLTFTVNPLPTISIGDNTNAVKFEDVKLTATGNNIADVTWIADKGTITKDATDPKKAVLTYDQAGAVIVTATATSEDGCTSVEATKTVTFGAENCSTGKTKIRFRKTYNNNEYYGFNTGSVYLYSWDSETGATHTGSYPGTLLSKTETINGITYYIHEFTNAQSTENLTILFRAQYDYGGTLGKTYDIPLSTPGATYQIELKNGDKKKETDDKDSDNSNSIDYFEVNSTPSGGGIIISTPAVKTVSVTSDEDGNVTMVGQVVKTGCDTQAILGLQYKKQKQDGTYDDVNYTTYPNPGTKEAISAGKTFTVTTKLEDGTYKVRARIDNSHDTNGYGEDINVVVNTVKTAISNVTLNYCDEYGEGIPDPNPMCKGATAYVKLSYVGSKYSDIKWLVEGVETDNVTDEGDGVWSYIIQGTGLLSVELRNDANKDEDNPTWATSNKLSFTMKEEPTAPYISINPASGIICEGSSATITVENANPNCSYKLVEEEEDPEAGFTQYVSGDLKYTVQDVAKYYVVAQHKACTNNEYTSNQVAINQIIRTNATISIDPDDPETTPWEPVTITVNPQEGYVYELSYTGYNLAGVDGVIIKQNGDSYTYYIPRPWGTGDATPVRTAVEYGIKAQLKVDGEASQCDLNYATATIQLKDEDNEDCNQ